MLFAAQINVTTELSLRTVNTCSFYCAMLCISAVYAGMRCPSVYLSVGLSRSWVLAKRINISSKFCHHWVSEPTCTCLRDTKVRRRVATWTSVLPVWSPHGIGHAASGTTTVVSLRLPVLCVMVFLGTDETMKSSPSPAVHETAESRAPRKDLPALSQPLVRSVPHKRMLFFKSCLHIIYDGAMNAMQLWITVAWLCSYQKYYILFQKLVADIITYWNSNVTANVEQMCEHMFL